MATPLTDAINALTAYANETTGASDTTLSDAVESLVAGYGGGGWSTDGIAAGTEPSGEITIGSTKIVDGAFRGKTEITGVTGINVTSVGMDSFNGCTNLTYFNFPALTSIEQSTFYNCRKLVRAEVDNVISLGRSTIFINCVSMTEAKFPKCTTVGQQVFNGCTALALCDIGNASAIGHTAFSNCKALKTLIIRNTNSVPTLNAAAFNGSTIANGGSGCTIYVPSALIESYKTAANWSTYYGYGTITFTAIEGSEYEI